MNWEFRAVEITDTNILIKEYASVAAEGLELWLKTHKAPKRKQPESEMSEYPDGFYHAGPSYRFRFRVYFGGKPIGRPEYDVSVKQTFYPCKAELPIRTRRINKVSTIC